MVVLKIRIIFVTSKGNNNKLNADMKKTFRILGMMLMAVVISMGMTACSESDDDAVKAEIYGKWYTERMEVHQSLDPDLAGTESSITEWMDFKDNGTVLFYDTELEEVITGQWTLKGDKLSIYEIDSDEYISYVYTVKKLTEEDLILYIEMPGILSATVYMGR